MVRTLTTHLTAGSVTLRETVQHVRDQAWRDYAGWRVNYDQVLLALAELTMASEAPWVSERVNK